MQRGLRGTFQALSYRACSCGLGGSKAYGWEILQTSFSPSTWKSLHITKEKGNTKFTHVASI